MITVTLNGEPKTITDGLSLGEAIIAWQPDGGSYAIAVNEQFVPRSTYESTHLQQGDRVELLVPMQGG